MSLLKRELELTSSKRLFKWPRVIINNFWQDCDRLSEDLKNNINFVFDKNKKTYDILNSKISPLHLKSKLATGFGEIQGLSSTLILQYEAVLNKKRAESEVIFEKIKNVNPVTILKRGFSITRKVKNGELLKDINTVNIGEFIETVVKNGKIYSRITGKK